MRNVEKTRAHEIAKKTAELEVEISNSAKKHAKSVGDNENLVNKIKPDMGIEKTESITKKTKSTTTEKEDDSYKIDKNINQLKKVEKKVKVEKNLDVLKGKVRNKKPNKIGNVKTEKIKNVKKYNAKREPELADTSGDVKLDKRIKRK